MQTFFCICYRIGYNVRRYVALVRQLADGGACFCTRGAMQGYDVVLFILALAKTMTPRGSPRREPGRPAPPATKRSSLAIKFSRCGKPMTYTDLLAPVNYFLNTRVFVSFLEL
jgi:hypothetical protein